MNNNKLRIDIPLHGRERAFGDDALLNRAEGLEKVAMLNASRDDQAQVVGPVVVAVVLLEPKNICQSLPKEERKIVGMSLD